jgi:hypothetical protein
MNRTCNAFLPCARCEISQRGKENCLSATTTLLLRHIFNRWAAAAGRSHQQLPELRIQTRCFFRRFAYFTRALSNIDSFFSVFYVCLSAPKAPLSTLK